MVGWSIQPALPREDMATLTEIVQEFLELCTRPAPVQGRGKRGAEKFDIPSTTQIKEAFRAWSGCAGDIALCLKRMGYAARTHSRVYCYLTSSGAPLIFKPEYPPKRPSMSERTSGSS